MKLVSYRLGERGKESYGVWDGEGIVPAPLCRPHGPRSLLELLTEGPAGVEELRSLAGNAPDRLEQAEVELLAPLPRPGKLIGLAVNYAEHHREFDRGHDLPEKAFLTPRPFLMPPTAVAHPGDVIPWPEFSREIDYEAELAVVIGRPTKNVAPHEALEFVAGYTVANDLSARSVTHAEGRRERPRDAFFDWLHGKWADGFCPLGPCLVTADEIPHPQGLTIRTLVNGEIRQDADTGLMIFSVAEVIAFCSRLMTLEPGDVIATGTPSGVGKATGRLLEAGDSVTCSVSGIGDLAVTLGPRPEEFHRPCARQEEPRG